MNINGKSILGFLHRNYDFVHRLFSIAKQTNFFIKEETLKDVCREFEVAFDTLTEYRIVREQRNNEYNLPSVYVHFLSHLLSDFSMPLHESVDKYRVSIANYYTQLLQEKEHNKVNDLINSLVSEIEEFSEIIENRTQQLLKETRELKSNLSQIDYLEKARKATYWIDNYIIPLNDILERENPHSVYQELTLISDFASRQQYSYSRFEIRSQFNTLYHHSNNIIEIALKNQAIIQKELLPLAERIKSESQILTGTIAYLEDIRQVALGLKKAEELPQITFFENTRLNHTLYSESFGQDAKFLWERLKEDDSFVLQPTENEVFDTWFFDLETKNYYKKKLIQDLPIDNFFQWCYTSLQTEYQETETQHINTEKFFAISSLLFLDEEFEKDFQVQLDTIFEPEKVEIRLTDLILEVPKIHLKTLKK
ncbi:hypothetical protein C7N43_22255 [Sphingobacteriales bacterium UPWRP_1]|nr:hypothetical protein BVG80_16415 [Sphingobacteriales bacterium TSM_CSM]PSJ74801.1 hypothetical protein C7N43_22255 [Sphingobacteriales bacterium UPWRP_1]